MDWIRTWANFWNQTKGPLRKVSFRIFTVSRVYADSGKTIPAWSKCCGYQYVNGRAHQKLPWMNRRAIVQYITHQFNAGAEHIWAQPHYSELLPRYRYRSHHPTRVLVLTAITRYNVQRGCKNISALDLRKGGGGILSVLMSHIDTCESHIDTCWW